MKTIIKKIKNRFELRKAPKEFKEMIELLNNN